MKMTFFFSRRRVEVFGGRNRAQEAVGAESEEIGAAAESEFGV